MIIKEKVKKIELPSRTLHGHVCVDLHNHNSGFTERVEADNLVTNALNEIIFMTRQSTTGNSAYSTFYPIHSVALGGLMLFDNVLTENVNNTAFPSDAHLVAFAGQTSDVERTYKGSLNSVESEKISGGFKTVWDFGTSQANGTIKALSRTHFTINDFLCPSSSRIYITNGAVSIFHPSASTVWINETTNKAYLVCGASNYKTIYEIDSIYFKNIPVAYYAYSEKEISQTAVATLENSYNDVFRHADEDYVYVKTSSQIYKIKMSDESFTETLVGNYPTPPNVDGVSGSHSPAYNSVSNGYLYIGVNYGTSPRRYFVYKYNLSNMTDVTAIEITNEVLATGATLATNNIETFPLSSGAVAVGPNLSNTTYNFCGVIYPDGTKFFTNYPGRSGADQTVGIFNSHKHMRNWIYTSYQTIVSNLIPAYLGTIANIEPVTKTASQSMKITYTLTNE